MCLFQNKPTGSVELIWTVIILMFGVFEVYIWNLWSKVIPFLFGESSWLIFASHLQKAAYFCLFSSIWIHGFTGVQTSCTTHLWDSLWGWKVFIICTYLDSDFQMFSTKTSTTEAYSSSSWAGGLFKKDAGAVQHKDVSDVALCWSKPLNAVFIIVSNKKSFCYGLALGPEHTKGKQRMGSLRIILI